MKNSESNPSKSRIVGYLLLFAAPFLSMGLYAFWCTTSLWSEYSRMKSWVEAPAIIKSTDLETRGGAKRRRYKVFATYDYEYNKQQYAGNRVTLISGRMATSLFNRDAHEELKRHRLQQTPFRCYVNPDSPQESILYRSLPGASLAYSTILATIPGSIGVGLLTVALGTFAFGSIRAARNIAPTEPSTQRSDPAAGQIQSNEGRMRSVVLLAAIGIYWSIASLPLDRKIVESISNGGGVGTWLATVFPLVGILLLARAILFLFESSPLRSFDTPTGAHTGSSR